MAGKTKVFEKVSSPYCFIFGYEVAKLVEALRYKLEGRGFDS